LARHWVHIILSFDKVIISSYCRCITIARIVRAAQRAIARIVRAARERSNETDVNRLMETQAEQHGKRQRRYGWVVFVIIPILAAVAVYLLWWPGVLRSDPPDQESGIPIGHRVGQQARDFTLPTFAGNPVSLSDYRGDVVVLDFWASWCIPCRLTMPVIEELVQQFPEIVLLGVSLDRSRSDAVAYLESRAESTMIAVYGSLSAASAVSRDYAVSGIPRTFVIDREGIIRFADHPANLTARTIESLL